MKFTIQVSSSQPQAKNWIAAGLRRNLTGFKKADILKACKDTAKELGLKVKRVKGIYLFEDRK